MCNKLLQGGGNNDNSLCGKTLFSCLFTDLALILRYIPEENCP